MDSDRSINSSRSGAGPIFFNSNILSPGGGIGALTNIEEEQQPPTVRGTSAGELPSDGLIPKRRFYHKSLLEIQILFFFKFSVYSILSFARLRISVLLTIPTNRSDLIVV